MTRNSIFSGILAVCSLFSFSSCQKETGVSGNDVREIEIVASVSEGLDTYLSGDGGIVNVDGTNYDQRYILEVYDGDKKVYREVKTVEVGARTSFSVRLLAKEYRFAFWSDFVGNGLTEDNVYETDNGLSAVTFSTTDPSADRKAGQEIADAYCTSDIVDLSESGVRRSFTLTRPFGKIRLVSTDVKDNAAAAPSTVTVSYGNDVQIPAGYNVLTGQVSEARIPAGSYVYTACKETVTVGGMEEEHYILGTDYVFAGTGSMDLSFSVEVYGNTSREIKNIPVTRNKLTTVIGNFYSSGSGTTAVVVE